jgi:hypothetical protein
MSKQPGVIYDLGNGKYGIAYNKDQQNQFMEKGKVYVHVFYDPQCTEPVRDSNKLPYKTLKAASQIKRIGLTD